MTRPRKGCGVLPRTAKEAEEEQVPFGTVVEGLPGGEEVGEEDVVCPFLPPSLPQSGSCGLPFVPPALGEGEGGREGGKAGGEEADEEEEGLRGKDEGGSGGMEGGEEELEEEEGGGGGVVGTEGVQGGEVGGAEGED